jgi:4-hydroxybenzoate polyprenyltransferase
VTVVLAVLAGGTTQVVLLLGAAMLGFQSSIGATNDLADRVEDARRGARKPILAGQIGLPTARLVAVAGAMVGLGLSAVVGPGATLVGAVGLMTGIAYDLWLRPRGLEVVAYAIAIPALLVYAWSGAAGTLPPGGLALVALAASIGPGLYLANALVDVDLDTLDGARGLVPRLGQRGSVASLALVVAATHALAWLLWMDTSRPPAATIAMLVGGVAAVTGVILSARPERSRRSLGWMVQALGTAALGIGLVAALSLDAGAPAVGIA